MNYKIENLNFFYEKFNLSEHQKEQFQQYYELIYQYNKVMNLTGIDEKFSVYLKHFYDSLLIVNEINEDDINIADLGSGAGFPGIVLAIYYPQKSFFLIEPITKRCKFLEIVKEKLFLKNVVVLNKRAELLEKNQYDLVCARAVTHLSPLLELSIPLLKIHGKLIALKGSMGEEELVNAQNALKILKSKVVKIDKLILPFEESKRINIIIQKCKETPQKYPRDYSQIKKRPL